MYLVFLNVIQCVPVFLLALTEGCMLLNGRRSTERANSILTRLVHRARPTSSTSGEHSTPCKIP